MSMNARATGSLLCRFSYAKEMKITQKNIHSRVCPVRCSCVQFVKYIIQQIFQKTKQIYV